MPSDMTKYEKIPGKRWLFRLKEGTGSRSEFKMVVNLKPRKELASPTLPPLQALEDAVAGVTYTAQEAAGRPKPGSSDYNDNRQDAFDEAVAKAQDAAPAQRAAEIKEDALGNHFTSTLDNRAAASPGPELAPPPPTDCAAISAYYAARNAFNAAYHTFRQLEGPQIGRPVSGASLNGNAKRRKLGL